MSTIPDQGNSSDEHQLQPYDALVVSANINGALRILEAGRDDPECAAVLLRAAAEHCGKLFDLIDEHTLRLASGHSKEAA